MIQGKQSLWEQRIKEQKRSGLTVAVWCEQNQLTKHTFYYWRKRISDIVNSPSEKHVNMQFKLDPFSPNCVFIFCDKRKTSIKVLRYDRNRFILAAKKLLEGMKFQWPKNPSQVKEISLQQVEWLLQGLEMEQKKALHEVEMKQKNSCY